MFEDESTAFHTPAINPAGLDLVGECGGGGTAAIRCGGSGDVGEGDELSPLVGAFKVEAEDELSAGGGRLAFALRSGTRDTDTTTLPRSLAAMTSSPARGVGVESGSASQLVPTTGGAEIVSERAGDCGSAACVSSCDIGKFSEEGAGDLLTSPLIQLLRWGLVGRAGASAAAAEVKGRLELLVPEFGGRSAVRIRGGSFGVLVMDVVDADAAGGSEKNRFDPVAARVDGPGDAKPAKEGLLGCGAATVAAPEVGRGAPRASKTTPSAAATAKEASPFRVYWYEPANAWHAVVSGESRACRDWNGAAARALMSAIAAACGEGGILLEAAEGCWRLGEIGGRLLPP